MEEVKLEVDANQQVLPVSDGQEGGSLAQQLMEGGGEIPSQENDAHEYHAQGEAQALAVEISDPIEEEVKQECHYKESITIKMRRPLPLLMSVEDGGT